MNKREYQLQQHLKEEEDAINGIGFHITRLKDALTRSGIVSPVSEIKITIGVEIEFIVVAGQEAHRMRLDELSDLGVLVNQKGDDYLPPLAQTKRFAEVFNNSFSGAPVRVESELNSRLYIGTDLRVIPDESGFGTRFQVESRAFHQKELISPPLSPLEVVNWITLACDRLMTVAKEMGLIRIETRTRPHVEVRPNNVHLNCVIWEGEQNLLVGSQPNGSTTVARLSELALCIGHSANEFIRDAYLLFEPAANTYWWRSLGAINGPVTIGLLQRKSDGSMPSMIFRGGGRIGARPETEQVDGITSASGPLRIELRAPLGESIGHPNKSAYVSQRAFPARLVEALMVILANGAEMLTVRRKHEHQGIWVNELSEAKLLEELYPLPVAQTDAIETFKASSMIREFYGSRIGIILEQIQILDKILQLDSSPRVSELGPQVDRSINYPFDTTCT